jgi:hypothetical protein
MVWCYNDDDFAAARFDPRCAAFAARDSVGLVVRTRAIERGTTRRRRGAREPATRATTKFARCGDDARARGRVRTPRLRSLVARSRSARFFA